jgi:4-amino-4-deoxy-L-arabinose transferase-like glycosyltransferase
MIFSFDNYLDYMNLQRYLGVIISIITTIPLYFLCKVFVEKKYAMIACVLFAFNPRIIENSILGITEPMYILSITLMLYTFFQYGRNYPYITFGIIGIISIIRYEGLLLFVPISLLYFYKFKFSKKTILKYFIAVTIFLLIIIPWGMMKIDLIGHDGLISNISAGPKYYNAVASESQDPNETISLFLKTGFNTMLRFFALATLPLLTFLIPLGIYTMISKKELSNFLILFCITLTLLIPVFYAYSRSYQEVRYLLPIFPIFCLFSVYFIRRITEKIKFKKLFLILISILVISSTVGFIEYKNSDDVNQTEAYEVTKEITKLTKVVTYYSQAGYLDNTRILEVDEFPILRKELPPSIVSIYPDNYETFEEYISDNKKNGLEYVIVDKGDWRSKFLVDVFKNEEKYPYLIKIFDSKDNGYKNYHAKIFKINFEEFDKLKSINP